MKSSRWSAAGIHLAISFLIAVTVVSIIFFVWYPGPLLSAVGGRLILSMIIGVDVCLGPLLTLIIFNPSKPRKLLALDLSVIATLQLLALGYGLHATFAGRPVFMVYGQGYFIAVTANQIDDRLLKSASNPKFQSLALFGPRWVGAKQPGDRKELSDLAFYQAMSGMGIHYQPKYYVELPELRNEIIREAIPLEKLSAKHPDLLPMLNNALSHLKMKIEGVGFVPLHTKSQTMIVLVDKETGVVLDTLEINPS